MIKCTLPCQTTRTITSKIISSDELMLLARTVPVKVRDLGQSEQRDMNTLGYLPSYLVHHRGACRITHGHLSYKWYHGRNDLLFQGRHNDDMCFGVEQCLMHRRIFSYSAEYFLI